MKRRKKSDLHLLNCQSANKCVNYIIVATQADFWIRFRWKTYSMETSLLNNNSNDNRRCSRKKCVFWSKSKSTRPFNELIDQQTAIHAQPYLYFVVHCIHEKKCFFWLGISCTSIRFVWLNCCHIIIYCPHWPKPFEIVT